MNKKVESVDHIDIKHVEPLKFRYHKLFTVLFVGSLFPVILIDLVRPLHFNTEMDQSKLGFKIMQWGDFVLLKQEVLEGAYVSAGNLSIEAGQLHVRNACLNNSLIEVGKPMQFADMERIKAEDPNGLYCYGRTHLTSPYFSCGTMDGLKNMDYTGSVSKVDYLDDIGSGIVGAQLKRISVFFKPLTASGSSKTLNFRSGVLAAGMYLLGSPEFWVHYDCTTDASGEDCINLQARVDKDGPGLHRTEWNASVQR